MKFWMRKIAVVLITIATLGIYTPTALLEMNTDESEDTFSSNADVNETVSESSEAEQIDFNIAHEEIASRDYVVNQLTEKAKEQTITKFGPKIADRVEDEFTSIILPNIESVLQTIVEENASDDYTYFAITEEPAKGYGERIFNVYDNKKDEDVAKFHVRRDNRPLEGYYFNFHYHLSNDGFKEHYNLGEIFWEKNTPPKWMA
ncbi:YpjP family protein [Oceanobacillus saliphilus]|uniref:YpjP family protein n=1 Tax=Oceanobacillus saliphilus TaxID=2925834 RepID=UPI00201D7E51|nr:YpjP family protein [Oceanobacillus saliphilus]